MVKARKLRVLQWKMLAMHFCSVPVKCLEATPCSSQEVFRGVENAPFYTTPMPKQGPNKGLIQASLDLALGWAWYRRVRTS